MFAGSRSDQEKPLYRQTSPLSSKGISLFQDSIVQDRVQGRIEAYPGTSCRYRPPPGNLRQAKETLEIGVEIGQPNSVTCKEISGNADYWVKLVMRSLILKNHKNVRGKSMKAINYVALVAIVLSISVTGCETITDILAGKRPTASMEGLRFSNIDLKSATLLFDVKVTNPYDISLPLLNLDYDVSSAGNQLFSGKADIQSTIPAKESKTVSLPAKLSYMDLARAFKDVRPGSKIPYKAALGLLVDTPVLGSIRLPMDKSSELEVPSIPKIGEIDWKKLLHE